MAHPPQGSAQKERIRFTLYCAAVILRAFFVKVQQLHSRKRQSVERVSRFARPYATPSVGGGNGVNEPDLQAALHVLVNTYMRLTVCVVECPGAELVYVACIVP